MKSACFRILPALLLIALLGGCASYDSQFDRGRNVASIRRFFVVSNLNDNHALDRQIAAVIKARGFEAESGPLTMMPDDTQAILTFRDHWTWDFGDHLVYLQVSIRDRRSEQPFGSVTFSAKIPLREAAPVTVARLVNRLLDKK